MLNMAPVAEKNAIMVTYDVSDLIPGLVLLELFEVTRAGKIDTD